MAGFSDDGVSVFSVANNGLLANQANVTDAGSGSLELDGATSVTTALVADTTYLFVAGLNDSGVSVFRVTNTDLLANVHNVPDDGTLNLSVASSVTTALVADTTYLFVTGVLDGVSVFRVGDTGALINVTNVSDDGTLNLASPRSVTTALVADTTYLFVAGFSDDMA